MKEKPFITHRYSKKVLHIIFPHTSHTAFLTYQKHPERHYVNYELCKDVLDASARYEGKNQFVGFNFPVTSVTKKEYHLYELVQLYPETLYVIAYLEKDTESMKHEERHARFYMDTNYRRKVERAWEKIQLTHPEEYKQIVKQLEKSEYQQKVFVDEFQAYYPEWIDKLQGRKSSRIKKSRIRNSRRKI
jgi:hypothetical protein